MLLSHFFIRKEKQDLFGYWNNYTYFYLMVLILFGIFPTLKFYELAYETESRIRVRHLMFDFANQKEKRNLDLHNYFSEIKQSDGNARKVEEIYVSRKKRGIYGDMIHGLKFSDEVTINSSNQKKLIIDSISPNKSRVKLTIDTTTDKKSGRWEKLINFLRPYYDDYVVENKYLLHETTNHKYKSWYITDNGRILLLYPSLTNNFSLDEIEYNAVSAELPKLSLYLPFSFNGMREADEWLLNVLFWIMVGILIYIFYALISFSISQIFTRKIITNFHYQDFGKTLHQQKLANKDIMVYRLSRRDHSTACRDDFVRTYGRHAIDTSSVEKMAKTQRNIDSLIRKCKKLSETEAQNPLTLRIDYFDVDFDNPDFFIQKMRIIRKYVKRSDIHLVIFSQLIPAEIAKHYSEDIDKLLQDKIGDTKSINLQVEAFRKIIKQLDDLMITLLITPLPVLYHRPEKVIENYCTEKPRHINNDEMIEGELSASDYLRHYNEALIAYKSEYIEAKGIKEGEELIINKINTLAGQYYNDLFGSCNAEEKYVLFDMAHDQIVNPKNEAAIHSLLKKGLLVKKCYKINFMNMSFRRFIMSKITKPEKLKIEAALGKQTGTWQNYRNALLLVIVALFIFIAMANQDFLDNLNNLFVALGGIIAVVTGVLGLLSQKGKPTSD